MSPMVPKELDPGIAGLLAEAVSDPHARVFHLDPSASGGAHEAVHADVVSPRLGGLSLVERHLLAVHREEVGFLLREAFCRTFTSEQQADRAYTRRFESQPLDQWQQRARFELDSFDGQADMGLAALTTLAEQQATSTESPLGGLNASELATIALRFEANDQARIYCAADLQQRGQHRASGEILGRVLDGHPTRTNAWCAWRNLGYSELMLDRRDRALDRYEHAARIGATQVDLWGWMFALALAVQDTGRASLAARHIDDLESNAKAPWIQELRADLEHYGAMRKTDSSGVRSGLGTILDQLGPVSTEVAHALPI